MFRLVQRRRIYFTISIAVILLGVAAMVVSYLQIGTPFRIGVDFQSGTRFEVQFEEPVTEDQIREVFVDFGIANPAVTSLQGQDLENAWQIRSEFLSPEESETLERAAIDEYSKSIAFVRRFIGNARDP